MRTRDVMSSPAVTVPPDAPLKEVAATLIEHGINAVPVVDGDDRLVGIISEADLLPLEAMPDHGVGRARATARDVMSRSVYTLAEGTIEALQGLAIDVTGGVVTVEPGAGPLARQLLEALALTVPGVVEVRGRRSIADGLTPDGDRR